MTEFLEGGRGDHHHDDMGDWLVALGIAALVAGLLLVGAVALVIYLCVH